MGMPLATVVGQFEEFGEFQLPPSGDDWKSRNWRGARQEAWDAHRELLWQVFAQPEIRRPRFGYAADNGR